MIPDSIAQPNCPAANCQIFPVVNFFIFFLLALIFIIIAQYIPLCNYIFVLIVYFDIRVKRSKSRSCLHDKAFELGTRRT